MNSLIELIRRFNRKERNWLIRDAFGQGSESLCDGFKRRIAEQVNRNDPEFAWQEPFWWGADYHLDWLVAALTCWAESRLIPPHDVRPNSAKLISGSQQDVDFLIATNNRLILIEAKGVGDWYGRDFKEKINRLKNISTHLLDEDGRIAGLRLHFLLCSPGKAPRINVLDWPKWMRDGENPRFVELNVPTVSDTYLRVERCGPEGDPASKGGHWHIVPMRSS
jgi:hypothetical protein